MHDMIEFVFFTLLCIKKCLTRLEHVSPVHDYVVEMDVWNVFRGEHLGTSNYKQINNARICCIF